MHTALDHRLPSEIHRTFGEQVLGIFQMHLRALLSRNVSSGHVGWELVQGIDRGSLLSKTPPHAYKSMHITLR